MKRIKLDRIDLRILRNLQEQGRMSNVDLAKFAGISAPPCLRRVRALEVAGYIKAYHAELDAEKMGYGVTVFAQVGLQNQGEAELKKFIEKVNAWQMVRECHMLAGEYDFLLKIVAPDWDTYQKFLTAEITTTPNVAHVRSTMTVRSTKYQPGVPIDENLLDK